MHSHRQGLEAITKPTFLTLSAPLTIPWQDYTVDSQGNVVQELSDTLAVVSRSADVSGSLLAKTDDDTQTGAPKDGASSVDGWTIDAMTFFQGNGENDLPHLIGADKNDDFALIHNVKAKVIAATEPTTPDPWASYTWRSAKEVFRPAPFTMNDGGSTTLTGSFEALPQKTFSLDYKGSLWNALLSDTPSPDLYTAALEVSVYGEHGAPSVARGGYASLARLDIDARVSDVNTLVLPGDYAHEFSYGNPLNGGQELARIEFTYWVVRTLYWPIGTHDIAYTSLAGSFILQAPVSELSGAPIKPVVGLPRNVRVNGEPAPMDTVTPHVGTTPEISFDAPALGSPDSYKVQIANLSEFQTPEGDEDLLYSSIGFILLSGTTTRVKIPEGLLEAGRFYHVMVSAIADDKGDPAAPYRRSARFASATTFTGIMSP